MQTRNERELPQLDKDIKSPRVNIILNNDKLDALILRSGTS